MKLGQHFTLFQTSLHFYYRHEIEKVCGKYKRFYERRLLNLRCIKKFPLMRVNVEDDAYKHYNSGNGYDNSMRMAEGPPEET